MSWQLLPAAHPRSIPAYKYGGLCGAMIWPLWFVQSNYQLSVLYSVDLSDRYQTSSEGHPWLIPNPDHKRSNNTTRKLYPRIVWNSIMIIIN